MARRDDGESRAHRGGAGDDHGREGIARDSDHEAGQTGHGGGHNHGSGGLYERHALRVGVGHDPIQRRSGPRSWCCRFSGGAVVEAESRGADLAQRRGVEDDPTGVVRDDPAQSKGSHSAAGGQVGERAVRAGSRHG